MANLKTLSEQPERIVLGKSGANGLGNLIGLFIFAVVACVGLSSFLDEGGESISIVVIVALVIGLALLASFLNALSSTRVVIDTRQRTAERTDSFLFLPMGRREMSFNIIRDVAVTVPRKTTEQIPALFPIWQVQLQAADGSTLVVNERGTHGEMQTLARKIGAMLDRPVRDAGETPAPASSPSYTPASVVSQLMENLGAFAQSASTPVYPGTSSSTTPAASSATPRLRQDDAERKPARPKPQPQVNPPAATVEPVDLGAPFMDVRAELAMSQPAADTPMFSTPLVSYSAPPVLVLPAMPAFSSFAPAMDLPALPALGSPMTMALLTTPVGQEIKEVEIKVPALPSAPADVERAARDGAIGHYQKARQFYATRNFPAAQAAFERALELDPGNAAALNDLGILFFEQNKIAQAERVFRQTIALDPFSAPGRYNLGLTLWRLGKRSEAFEQFKLGARHASRNDAKHFANALRGVLHAPLASQAT
ncbi:MAG: tetratricopeptide repeat protein [Chloroflexi bacterium]|nr:tetratricopeptide repeat protein [Chloroflexota bacterium]